jgi:ComF family protein
VARVLRSPVLRIPLDALACALFPDACLLCGDPLARFSSVPVCDLCWTRFPALADSPGFTDFYCACCGGHLPAPAAQASRLCRACRIAAPPFVQAAAYGIFETQMREAIHALKFNNARVLARPLGRFLAAAIERLMQAAPPDLLVVPVPLHRRKEHQRGFNQARLLADYAIRELRRSHPEWKLTLASRTLIRHKETLPQTGLTPRQRRLNLKEAFPVGAPEILRGRDLLLIDDVLTTGATARAAARVLLAAGARSVRVATVARTVMKGARVTSSGADADGGALFGAMDSRAARRIEKRLAEHATDSRTAKSKHAEEKL